MIATFIKKLEMFSMMIFMLLKCVQNLDEKTQKIKKSENVSFTDETSINSTFGNGVSEKYLSDTSLMELDYDISINDELRNYHMNENESNYTTVSNHVGELVKNKEKMNSSIHNSSQIGSKHRRNLQFNDASMSIISGSGIQDFVALEEKTIVVEPRDSSNTSWGSGHNIYIQISNKCTYDSLHSSCDINLDAENVTDYHYSLMTDNGDGTYSYNFTIEKPGVISVYIVSSVSNSINATVYTGRNFDSTPIYETWIEFNRTYESLYNSGSFSTNFKSST